MVSPQLIDYIRLEIQKGFTPDSIRSALLAKGWKTEFIDEAFASVQAPSVSTPPASVVAPITAKPHKKIHGCLIALIICVVIILGLNFGVPIVLNIVSHDIAPINDEDLAIQESTLSDSQNSYQDVLGIKDAIFDVSNILEAYKKTNSWNTEAVQTALSKNAKTLELAQAIRAKDGYNNPYFKNLSSISLSNWNDSSQRINPISMLQLGRLFELSGQLLLHQGKEEEALTETLKSSDVGQKIMETQPNLTEYLVGIAMKNIGLSASQKILLGKNLSTATLLEKIVWLERYKNTTSGLLNALKSEYLFSSLLFNAVQNGNQEELSMVYKNIGVSDIFGAGKIQSYLLQPNKTKQIFARFYRSAISDITNPCSTAKNNTPVPAITRPSPFMIFTQNALGNILSQSMLRALDIPQQNIKRCNDLVLISITQVLYAMKAYKNDTGKLPPNLTDLMPKYVQKIPEDPYSESPIQYSYEKGILYSVGVNGVDAEGSTGDDWTKMPNPTFRIGF